MTRILCSTQGNQTIQQIRWKLASRPARATHVIWLAICAQLTRSWPYLNKMKYTLILFKFVMIVIWQQLIKTRIHNSNPKEMEEQLYEGPSSAKTAGLDRLLFLFLQVWTWSSIRPTPFRVVAAGRQPFNRLCHSGWIVLNPSVSPTLQIYIYFSF